MRVAIAGGNSYVGQGLTRRLLEAGDAVTWLSHHPGRVFPPHGVEELAFDPARTGASWAVAVAHADAVVNLSGHPIASRWNARVKELLRASQIETTRALVGAIRAARETGGGPTVFVCASGIGIYGDRGDHLLAEDAEPGDDWLARLARDWEAEASRATEAGCRTVILRTAPVLGSEGLVPRLVLPFRLFVGGPVGSGNQWMAWIHYDDLTGLYAAAVHDTAFEGPINACAPGTVRAREIAAAFGRALRRLSWLPVPGFALRLVLGEVAPSTLFSQRASAEKALAAGYMFEHPISMRRSHARSGNCCEVRTLSRSFRDRTGGAHVTHDSRPALLEPDAIRRFGRRRFLLMLGAAAAGLPGCTMRRTTPANGEEAADVTPTATVVSGAAGQDPQRTLSGVIQRRRSVRAFREATVSDAQVAKMLWAAQGVTDTIRGFRAAPSAGALYPLELYVASTRGLLRYVPVRGELRRIGRSDVRAALARAALGQGFIAEAPVVFVMTGVYARTEGRYGERAVRYVHMEAGHAAQNLLLMAVDLDLGAVPVGAFDDDGVRKVIGASPEEAPLYVIPVGPAARP